jgi:hypothetical protein
MVRTALCAALLLCLAAAAPAGPPAPAELLVAECADPAGRTVGHIGGHDVDTPDAMTGGRFIFRIDRNAHTAVVVGDDARGGRLTTRPGIMLDRADAISLIEQNGTGAVWLYTLFPKAGRVLITRHWGAAPMLPGPDTAIGTVLTATCSFGTAEAPPQ